MCSRSIPLRAADRRTPFLSRSRVAAPIAIAACVTAASPVLSDEGGVSFWLPGQMGSFSAVPGASD